MLDPKAYRDTVLLPLQKNSAQQAAVAEALRGINDAQKDADVVAALTVIDAAALFAVTGGQSDAELATHFKSVEMFLNKGRSPAVQILGTLLKTIKAKVPTYLQTNFWDLLRQAAVAAGEEKLESFGAAVKMQEAMRVISAERVRKAAASHGLPASITDQELADAIAKHGVRVVPDLDIPNVPLDAPPLGKLLHPSFRSIIDVVLLHERGSRPADVCVIDELSYQSGSARARVGVADLKKSNVAVNQRGDDASESAKKTLQAIALECESDADLHRLCLAWFARKADDLVRKQSVMLGPALQKLTGMGLADLDARRILAAMSETTGGPAITQVASLVAAGSLESAQRLFNSLTAGQEISTEIEKAQAALTDALARKKTAMGTYQSALRAQDYATARAVLIQARAVDKEDPEISRLLAQMPPDRPRQLQAALAQSGAVALTWLGTEDPEVRYAVVRSETGVPANPRDGHQINQGASETRAVDSAPPVARPVTYAVFAFRHGSDCSLPVATGVTVLPPPTNIEVSASLNDATIFWRIPTQSTGVSAELIAPDGRRTPFPVTGQQQLLVQQLELGQRYRAVLKAHYVLPDGQSGTSDGVSIEVVPRGTILPVQDLTVTGCNMPDGRAGLRCTWSEVPGYPVELWSLPLDLVPAEGARVTEDSLLDLTGSRITGSVRISGAAQSMDIYAFADVRMIVPITWNGRGGLTGRPEVAGSAPQPKNVEVLRLGSELVVSWHWPRGDYLTEVGWTGGDDRRDSRLLDRIIYNRDGGLRIPNADAVREVRVSTVARGADRQYVGAPVVVPVRPMRPSLSYTIELPRALFGSRQVKTEVSSPAFRGVAELIAVVATGKFMPTRAEDGDEIARLRLDFTCATTQPATFRVPKIKSPYWVRLFPARACELTLTDPPTSTMKG
ncbi:fibronectin type III domain-containing protein [Enemella evansiae]|uniref:hypothetical protein n=1 Tax=Enemella evansiae TaxID=2016499 RepID=UPI00117EBE36|nr:hypothetical protein [Enemella evansiae]